MARIVKELRQYRYDVLLNGPVEEIESWDQFLQNLTEFNPAGQPLREVIFDSYGNQEQVVEYQYDEKGLLIEERFYQEDGSLMEARRFERNQDDLMVREVQWFLDGSEDVTAYHYENEKLVLKKVVNSDGEEEGQEEFSYSGDVLIGEKAVDSQGNLITQTTYTFNEEGVLQESESMRQEEGITEKIRILFNESGNRIKTLRFNTKEQLTALERYNYSDAGKLESIEEENQVGHSFITFEYDEHGHVVRQNETSPNGGILSTITREYDEEGSLLEASVFIDGLNRRAHQNYLLRYDYVYYD